MNNKIKFFVPFTNEPESKPKEWSEFEEVWEFDSIKNNIINTGEKKNIQVAIDSYKDQTLIYNILDKYIGIGNDPQMLNNIPELQKREGQYMDISQLPKNIHELKKLSELAQKQIAQLEKEQQEINNADQLINTQNQTLSVNETNLQYSQKTEKTDKTNQ